MTVTFCVRHRHIRSIHFLLAFTASLIVCASLIAQEPVPSGPQDLVVVDMQRPPEMNELPPPRDEAVLPVFVRAVGTQAVTTGDKGDVILDGSGAGAYSTAGVFLRANTDAYPDVSTRLGGAGGSFRIFGPADALLLRVQASGFVGIGEPSPLDMLHISRNQDAVAGIRVSNNSTGTAAMRSLRFSAGSTVTAQISSAGSGNTGYAGGPNALLLWNHLSGPAVIGTADTERIRVHANGSVTVGHTGDWGARLAAIETRDKGYAALARHESIVEESTVQTDIGHAAVAVQRVESNVTNNGAAVATYSVSQRTGPGSSWRSVGLESRATIGTAATDTGAVTEAVGVLVGVSQGAGTIATGHGVLIEDVTATTGFGVYQKGANDLNYFAGNVGIRQPNPTHALHVAGGGKFTGDLEVDGNIAAKFQDLAEWVPSLTDLAPGTVVSLDPNHSNHVVAASRAYDTAVAGVVSAQPGIVLGEAGASKEQIATTGRVRVRVDATLAPIRIGDLLVSSEKAGTAMKSQPIEIQGISIHRPGTVIGKALEPLDGGVGEILVLLSLQ